MAQVRRAGSSDAVTIAGIINALMATTTVEWRNEPYSPDAMSAWIEAHDCVLVAEDPSGIVGVAAYGPFRDSTKWPGYRFAVENSVHVRSDAHGSGVGRALMERLVEIAAGEGRHVMISAVDGANQASIDFHRRLGFVEVARLPEVGSKFGKWLDLVLLERRLDSRPVPPPD